MRGLAGCTLERVCATGAGRRGASPVPNAREAGPEDGAERRGAGGGDPYGAEGKPVPGRGPPEGEGTACGQGDPGWQEPGAPADAGARSAGAGRPAHQIRQRQARGARLGVPLGTLGLAGADLHPHSASRAHDAPLAMWGSGGGTAPRQPPQGTHGVWPQGVCCSQP